VELDCFLKARQGGFSCRKQNENTNEFRKSGEMGKKKLQVSFVVPSTSHRLKVWVKQKFKSKASANRRILDKEDLLKSNSKRRLQTYRNKKNIKVKENKNKARVRKKNKRRKM